MGKGSYLAGFRGSCTSVYSLLPECRQQAGAAGKGTGSPNAVYRPQEPVLGASPPAGKGSAAHGQGQAPFSPFQWDPGPREAHRTLVLGCDKQGGTSPQERLLDSSSSLGAVAEISPCPQSPFLLLESSRTWAAPGVHCRLPRSPDRLPSSGC